jgi:integrase
MKERFYLFKRNGVYYVEDGTTGRQQSLKTKDGGEARRMVHAKNETVRCPVLNLAMAKVYMSAHDPKILERTWQDVMDKFCSRGKPGTQKDRRLVAQRPPQRQLRNMKLVETTADDFIGVLNTGGAMTNAFLRCLHNLALGLGWLPWPILPSKLWPVVRKKMRRGITREEHRRIIAAEKNVERRLYYEFLWETGAAQTDAAQFCAEQIDWQRRILSYQRQKTGSWAHLQIGQPLEDLLHQLPASGFLFVKIARTNNSARSAEFRRRCRILKLNGISLHSYRYAWAERAQSCGYPERWAQNALGHNSRAIHQAYAKAGVAICPPLDDYERIARKVQVTFPPVEEVANRGKPGESSGLLLPAIN